jgi:hypothetical protein
MPRTGRQPKLTPAVQTAICNAVQVGVPLVQAAQLVGIDGATALEWMARGEDRHQRARLAPYAEFAEAITRAKALDEARRLVRLEQAGRGGAVTHEKVTTFADGRTVTERHFSPPDWRADEFYLERAYPDRWGRKMQEDLRLQIEQILAEVAQEVGVSPEALLREAQQVLREYDARRLR